MKQQLKDPNSITMFHQALVDDIKVFTEKYGEYQYHRYKIYTEYEDFFTEKEIDLMVNMLIESNIITKINKKYIYENKFRTKTIFKLN